jgi:hypothetical protein
MTGNSLESDVKQLLTGAVPPYACAFALMFITSYSSDRFRDRGIHLVALSSVAAVAYVCLATLGEDKLSAKYGLVVSRLIHGSLDEPG